MCKEVDSAGIKALDQQGHYCPCVLGAGLCDEGQGRQGLRWPLLLNARPQETCGEFGENTCDMISSTVAMFEDPANLVSGHCFWTWKKTSSRFPALMRIEAPQAWRRVAAWIELPLDSRRPSRKEALRGVKGFLEAVAIDKCVLDKGMLEALTPRPRLRDAE